MGKYRTFSKSIFNFRGLDVATARLVLDGRNVHRQNPSKQPSPSILPVRVRGKNSWMKRKRGHTWLNKYHLLNFLICGSLVLFQSCSCTPVETEREYTNTNASSNASSNSSMSSTEQVTQKDGLSDLLILEESITQQSHLFNSPNCTPPSSQQFPEDLFTKEERQNGAITVHFLVSFYMLYALLLVCDEYFVPSVECICEELRIPHNIAGATFMAISTSAPELFTNVIGTFVTKGDLGLGTIVGSAVFNILAVGSCIGIGTHVAIQQNKLSGSCGTQRSKRKGVPLDWWSLTRDSTFYLISVGALIAILFDGRVYWPETVAMLILYGFYMAAMCYDAQCKHWFETLFIKILQLLKCEDKSARKLDRTVRNMEKAPLLRQSSSKGCSSDKLEKGQDYYSKPNPRDSLQSKPSRKASQDEEQSSKDELFENSSSSLDSGSSKISTASSTIMVVGAFKDVLAFPLRILLACTIPDCKKPEKRKWYAISLISCIVWIGGLSFVISWMVCTIGETFGIPDSVSGLTFLAAGTSLPEVLSSVIVARQGFGSMGLSNSIGSNTFDILVCLGLPWLIQSVILAQAEMNYIEIHSGGLEYSAVLLVSAMILIYLLIAINGYILDMKVGVACVLMYIIFITVACLLEMNVFFPVNLPAC